ncbi:MAG: sulfatase family protein [Solirubrobacterales bacterium]
MSGLTDRRSEWSSHETEFSLGGDGRPEKRPNIVFIFADDLGWGDVGAYGSLHNSTPVLDELAAEGLRFEQGYAASPTCSPTRFALYTGRYPGRTEGGLQEPLVSRDETAGIPVEHPTLPSLLRDSGYSTAMIGKWHCGWLPWFSPIKSGFQKFWGCFDGAVDYFSHVDTAGQHDLWEGEEPTEEAGYMTDLVSRRGAEYIREHDGDEPFYLHLNYTAPHWPWEGPGDQAVSEKVNQSIKEGRGTGLFHFEGGSLETYCEMVKALDTGIGEVLTALDEKGLKDETIVVFASDNGGERYAFLWPYVGQKGDLEEGGIRVPMIARWPGVISPSQKTDLPVITMDWTATLLDAAGVEPDPSYPLDGQSLLPWLIDGAEKPDRDLLWRTRDQGALRRGRFKLLYDRKAKPFIHGLFAKDGPRVRLFDVEADGREMADLAGEHPELLEELLAQWHEFDRELLEYPPPPRFEPGGIPGLED